MTVLSTAVVQFVYDSEHPRYEIIDDNGQTRNLALAPKEFQARANRDVSKISEFLLFNDSHRIVFTDPIQVTSEGCLEPNVESVVSGNTRTAILHHYAGLNIEEFKRLTAENATEERLQEFFYDSWTFEPFQILTIDPEIETDRVRLFQEINSKNQVAKLTQEDLALTAFNMMAQVRASDPNLKESDVKRITAEKLGRANTTSISFYQALHNQLNKASKDWDFWNLAFRKELLSADSLLEAVRLYKKFRSTFPDADSNLNPVYFYNQAVDLANKMTAEGSAKVVTKEMINKVFDLEIKQLTPDEPKDSETDDESDSESSSNGSRLAEEKNRILDLPEDELVKEIPLKLGEIDSKVISQLSSLSIASLESFKTAYDSIKSYLPELDVNSQRVTLGLMAQVEIQHEELITKLNEQVQSMAHQFERVIKRAEDKKEAETKKAEALAKAEEEKAAKKAETDRLKAEAKEEKARLKAIAAQEKAAKIAAEQAEESTVDEEVTA